MARQEYREIVRLHEMLVKAGLKHDFREWRNGYQVVYPSFAEWDKVLEVYNTDTKRTYVERATHCLSAIENDYSYGNWHDKIEIMGMLTAEEYSLDDVTVTTAEDAFGRIMTAENGREGA